MSQIFVTNKNDFIHEDKFNSEEFVFPPNEAVLVSIDAAVHMFGYGLEDQTDALVRLGWAMKPDPAGRGWIEDPEGIRKLAGFVFEEAEVRPRARAPLATRLDELMPTV